MTDLNNNREWHKPTMTSLAGSASASQVNPNQAPGKFEEAKGTEFTERDGYQDGAGDASPS